MVLVVLGKLRVIVIFVVVVVFIDNEYFVNLYSKLYLDS
jgi:hypothetical protein